MYAMQTLHAGGIPMFRGTYLVVSDLLLYLTFLKMFVLQSGFCEVVFPFIVHDVLTRGSDTCYKVFAKHFNKFFQQHCQHYNNKSEHYLTVISLLWCFNYARPLGLITPPINITTYLIYLLSIMVFLNFCKLEKLKNQVYL